jgi:tRNA (guanine-N7-)-methyltransferase
MSKKKMQRFAEMESFGNVVQPPFDEIFRHDHQLKGNWKPKAFGNQNPLVLELGCGKGEYTLGLARRFQTNNFIGVDIKGARIWRGARTALEENIPNVMFLRTHIEQINSFFDTDEADEIWITFPDPQLKKRRKRLTSPRFLFQYMRFLKNNGLVHLKTDNEVLYHYTLELAQINNFKVHHNTNDLYHSNLDGAVKEIQTYYEKQFLAQEMTIKYLCFELPNETTLDEPAEEIG